MAPGWGAKREGEEEIPSDDWGFRNLDIHTSKRKRGAMRIFLPAALKEGED